MGPVLGPLPMYAWGIGLRYLLSKKRSTVSVITVVAVGAVALGVGALLAVLSITSGFQDAFRAKVLGVNAHVLVLKYGLDFEEYRDVIAQALEQPEVAGAGPFVINEMMLAKGDRLSNVLVKGVDPEAMPTVLDLPQQITTGSLSELRLPGSSAPTDPFGSSPAGSLDAYLRERSAEWDRQQGDRQDQTTTGDHDDDGDDVPHGESGEAVDSLDPTPADRQREDDRAVPLGPPMGPNDPAALPEVDVPTLEEAQAVLDGFDADELPDDSFYDRLFEEEEVAERQAGVAEIATDELPGIVVGRTLARNLDLELGDRVRVISPLTGLDTSLWAPEARTPRSAEFRVIATFEAGFQEYDTRLVYVDIYEAQRFLQQGDTVTGVELRLHDLELAPELAERIETQLGGGPFHTMDWEELNHNLFTALEIQKVVLSIAIATIIVVAAFCVIATLIMVVLEKRREIAILKAMGAQDRGILAIFMIQGTVIGFVGTLLGLLVGGGAVAYLGYYRFPLDPKVYLIDHLPVRASVSEFVITTIVALLICSAATLFPSWWAARLLPADGVRYE